MKHAPLRPLSSLVEARAACCGGRSASSMALRVQVAGAGLQTDDVVLHEDDNSIYKLKRALNEFTKEPSFGVDTPVCNP